MNVKEFNARYSDTPCGKISAFKGKIVAENRRTYETGNASKGYVQHLRQEIWAENDYGEQRCFLFTDANFQCLPGHNTVFILRGDSNTPKTTLNITTQMLFGDSSDVPASIIGTIIGYVFVSIIFLVILLIALSFLDMRVERLGKVMVAAALLSALVCVFKVPSSIRRDKNRNRIYEGIVHDAWAIGSAE